MLKNADWLYDSIGAYDDEYLLLDLPGQIELYTHLGLVPDLIKLLQSWGDAKLAMVYLLESQFIDDQPKYFAGVLAAMSAMINLELPTINVMSKIDLRQDSARHLDRSLLPLPLNNTNSFIADTSIRTRPCSMRNTAGARIRSFTISLLPSSISFVHPTRENALDT